MIFTGELFYRFRSLQASQLAIYCFCTGFDTLHGIILLEIHKMFIISVQGTVELWHYVGPKYCFEQNTGGWTLLNQIHILLPRVPPPWSKKFGTPIPGIFLCAPYIGGIRKEHPLQESEYLPGLPPPESVKRGSILANWSMGI